MRRASKIAIPLVVLLLVGVGGFLWVHRARVEADVVSASDPSTSMAAVCARLDANWRAAYDAIQAGDPWEGAGILVLSLRDIPGEDPYFVSDELVDAGIAGTRLAVFIMAELMDEEMRQDFRDAVLEPDVYVTDDLVQLQYDVTHGPSYRETLVIVDRLWALAESSNSAARVGGLSILAAPYLFQKWPHRPGAREQLVAEYPDLEVTRIVLRWSLDACKAEKPAIAEAMAKVLEEELTSGVEQRILFEDEAVVLAAAVLPDLLADEHKEQGVQMLCSGITDSDDWKTRFACLNLAAGYRDIGHAQTVEPVVQVLAASGLDTPDVLRAQCLALGYAKDAGNIEEGRVWGEALLAWERIRDPLDRTLHEEVGNAIRRYGDFLAESGHPEEGARVHDRLAAKFPNSALAAKSLKRAAQIRGGRAAGGN